MRSVKDKILNWEKKSAIEGTTRPQSVSKSTSIANNNNPPDKQSNVIIENRLTQMSTAKNMLETLQINNMNQNLLPNAIPPRGSYRPNQQQESGRFSNNDLNAESRRNPLQSTSFAGSYQKQFLNIRGTIDMSRGQPPVPRNSVDVSYDGKILKPSMLKQKRMNLDLNETNQKIIDPESKIQNASQQTYLLPPSGRKTNNDQFLKSQVIKIDKGVHFRTQKLINTLFGEEKFDQFGNSKDPNTNGGMGKFLGSVDNDGNFPKFKSARIPVLSMQSQKQVHVRSKNKKTIGNFDNL